MRRPLQLGLLGMVSAVLAVTPGGALAQTATPAAGCAGAVEPVSQALTQTARDLNGMIVEVAAIETKLQAYYQSVAVTAGQAQPNQEQQHTAIAAAKKKAEAEIAQLPGLQLRCTPNPAASVARLDKEVGEATAATRDYRASVRTELLILRTSALKTATPGPDADRGAEG